jgi:tight adherence protein C
MTLVLIFGLVLVAVSVTLLVRVLTAPRARTVEALGRIPAYGYAGAAPEEARARRSILGDLANVLGSVVAPYIGSMRVDALRKQLVAAGMYSTPPRRFLGYQLISALAVMAFVAWLLIGSGRGLLVVPAALFGLLAGWRMPSALVGRRAKSRHDQIEYDLPELVDLLVVAVESGMGLTGSMRLATERLTGPLGDEMRLMLQEQQMGLASDEALRSLLERCETPGVQSFVRAILQGEQLGVSIGQIMRNLGHEMRKKRRAMAEERAQKAPVKVLFPLVFLIFPALFIVILGPAIFPVLDLFGE